MSSPTAMLWSKRITPVFLFGEIPAPYSSHARQPPSSAWGPHQPSAWLGHPLPGPASRGPPLSTPLRQGTLPAPHTPLGRLGTETQLCL